MRVWGLPGLDCCARGGQRLAVDPNLHEGFGFRVFRVSCFEFRVSDFGFRISGFGFWVWGLRLKFWVWGLEQTDWTAGMISLVIIEIMQLASISTIPARGLGFRV